MNPPFLTHPPELPHPTPAQLEARTQVVFERRRRERALRLNKLISWILPTEVLGALATCMTYGATDRLALGMQRWLWVLLLGLGAVLPGLWLAAQKSGERRVRVGMTCAQMLAYAMVHVAMDGHPDGQVFEFVSIALLSLYHDYFAQCVGLFLGTAIDIARYLWLHSLHDPARLTEVIPWDAATAIILTKLAACGLYMLWDSREQNEIARREAELEMETDLRRTMELQVRETSARYQRVVESNLIGICFWDNEGQVLDANNAYLELLGYDREDLRAGRLKHEVLTPPEWRRATDSTLLELAQRGFAPPTEKEYVRKDGGRIQVLRGSASLEGSTLGVSFVMDLRELKRLEKDLRAVLEANVIGVVFWDGDRWTEANDAFLEMVGYTREQMRTRKRKLSELLQDEKPERTLAGKREMDETGRFQLREMLLRHADGHAVPVMAAGLRLNRQPVHGVAFVMDMTAQKEAAKQLAAARDDLEVRVLERTAQLAAANHELSAAMQAAEAASRAKSQFLANMSHEIRTPMTAIQGFAELMQDPSLDDADRLAYAKTIRRNSDHLLGVLDDVLDLSRIEADRMLLSPERVRLVPLIQDVLELMQARTAGKDLTLKLRLETAVPEWIQVDALRLRQVLLNLVGNAVKFTQTGAVTAKVSLDHQQQLVIAIEDSGIGITQEQMEQLFQPFAQADASTTRRFGGSGLGLVISRRLVGLMGGELTAESREGHGSTFTVRLGANVLTDSPLRPHSEAVIAPGLTLPKTPKHPHLARVLVAEDGADNQLLLTTYLRHAHLEVKIAADGRQAVAQVHEASLRQEPFDLVLMDMQMPDLDGYAAARTLRDQGFTGPIVALTAHAMAGDREQCLAAGCTDYLAKPIERATLLAAIWRNLQPRDEDQVMEPPPVAG